MQHIKEFDSINILHNLVLLVGHFIVEVVMYLYDVFVVEFTQDVVLLLLGNLLLNVVKACYLDCVRALFLIVLLLIAFINRGMEALAYLFAAIEKLFELFFYLLSVANLIQFF